MQFTQLTDKTFLRILFCLPNFKLKWEFTMHPITITMVVQFRSLTLCKSWYLLFFPSLHSSLTSIQLLFVWRFFWCVSATFSFHTVSGKQNDNTFPLYFYVKSYSRERENKIWKVCTLKRQNLCVCALSTQIRSKEQTSWFCKRINAIGKWLPG